MLRVRRPVAMDLLFQLHARLQRHFKFTGGVHAVTVVAKQPGARIVVVQFVGDRGRRCGTLVGVRLGRCGGGQMHRCRCTRTRLIARTICAAEHVAGHVVEEQLLLSVELLGKLLRAVGHLLIL